MDPLNTTAQSAVISLPHDITTPELISQFPIAIGWWCVLIVFIALSIFTFTAIKKYTAKRRIQKQAINAIELSSSTITQTIRTLKWAAMAYFPRQELAPLSGEKLFDYLAKKLPEDQKKKFTPHYESVIKSLYRKDNDTIIKVEFNRAAIAWLTYALPPKKVKKGEKS